MPNSRRALILGELARERGVLDELHPRLFAAYWAQGLDIGDERVLVAEGAAVGLGESEILDALTDQRYLPGIESETAAAIELGATGVPAWLVDERLLIPGAQPHEVFARILGRLGYEQLDDGDARDGA